MSDATPHPLRLSRRELLLIFAFWTFMAALSVGNRFLDPRQLGFQLTNPSAPILLAQFLLTLAPALWLMRGRFVRRAESR